MRRSVFILLILAGLILVTAGVRQWVSPSGTHTPTAESQVSIRLKWAHQTQFAGIYVAREHGMYQQKGLDVDILERNTSGKPVLQQVSDGDVDFGIVSPQELLKAVDKGLPVIGLMVTYQQSPAAIISLKETGIDTLESLKGKTLGVTSDTLESRLFFISLLKTVQIDAADVTFRTVGFRQLDALLSKEIDAVSLYRTNDLYALRQRGTDYAMIVPEDHDMDLYDDVLITNRAMITSRQSVVLDFIRATREGWEYALQHPDEAVDATLHYAHNQYADRSYEEFILRESMPLIKPNDSQIMGDMNFDRWNKIYQQLRSSGIIKNFDVTTAYITYPF